MEASEGRGASSSLGASERRVLNPRPFRTVRRSVSPAETAISAAMLVLLACIAGWVGWRGAHPDPALRADASLVTATGRARVVAPSGPRASGTHERPLRAADDDGGRPGASVAPGADVTRPPAAPAPGLGGDGWTEGPASRFDAATLWEKIDGRADFFLARGFRSLRAITLSGPGGAAIDLELYDLGAPSNALGAFDAEKPPESKLRSAGGARSYLLRNALFLATGSTYLRALGSDESPAVVARLERLRAIFERGSSSGATAAQSRP